MVEYRDKVVSSIKMCRRDLKRFEESFSTASKDIEESNKIIDSLERSLSKVEEMIREPLKKAIIEEEKCIEKNKKILSYSKEKIEESKKYLTFLRHYVCPHEEATFEYEDYHKGVTYYKCNLCEAVF